ncbi:hypothetical protein HYPSUDRAFT_858445 [Hypholoma sublateritium FD-334 SS-4]|uniref:Uncharacterized protein n=1 Tax=Hypholoma sublateritium (strain FD-334 SS-4) TaxID=945553 RepID=A0A0D2NSC9_HYPSF|nr:hypothetical protein HYPSUDRAFT_858445 [Hypholoma sublateritium FD-334 SS-4]
MTEYDYSPEGLNQFRTIPDRLSQWSGSQRYPSQNGFVPSNFGVGGPFDTGLPYDGYDDYDDSAYGREHRSHRRGRSPTRRPLNGSYRSRSNERFYPDVYNSGQIPTPSSFHNFAGVDSMLPPFGSRHTSLNQGYLPNFRSHDGRVRYDQPAIDTYEYPSSRRSYSRSRQGRYPSSHIRLPHSNRSRSRASSRGSYSSQSYSSRSRSRSYSPSRRRNYNNYRTVHASSTRPTVIQTSRDYPTVVPINGGVGGYVVVPAAGQSLRVVNPSKNTLLGRLLSPSKWGIMRRKY